MCGLSRFVLSFSDIKSDQIIYTRSLWDPEISTAPTRSLRYGRERAARQVGPRALVKRDKLENSSAWRRVPRASERAVVARFPGGYRTVPLERDPVGKPVDHRAVAIVQSRLTREQRRARDGWPAGSINRSINERER